MHVSTYLNPLLAISARSEPGVQVKGDATAQLHIRLQGTLEGFWEDMAKIVAPGLALVYAEGQVCGVLLGAGLVNTGLVDPVW